MRVASIPAAVRPRGGRSGRGRWTWLDVTIALAYGLRRGEVLGLRWQNLDWEAGTLRLTHPVKRIKERDKSNGRKTRVVVSELKAAKTRQTLVLTPEILAKLRKLHSDQAKARLALGCSLAGSRAGLPVRVGTPTGLGNFSHAFSRLAKRAGLGHWHPHELRHSVLR